MSEIKNINATIKVTLKPWAAPNFATRPTGEGEGIPVKELHEDTLEDMALAWLDDLYRKAGKRSPFFKHAKMGSPHD